jgi:putative endonuclease
MLTRQYFVYMMTNRHRSSLYTGVTRDLQGRIYKHKSHILPGFTSRYGVDSLVYFEETGDILAAIGREKEIKGWTRAKKIALIESTNPEWRDLSEGWFDFTPRLGPAGAPKTANEAWVHPAPPPDSFAKGSRSANRRAGRSE